MARRLAITVRGIVQGVGFRPFVYNMALALGLDGWVVNQSDAVRIEVEGADEAVDRFLDRLRNDAPLQATIQRIETAALPCERDGSDATARFEIRASREGAVRQPTIPPDLATCDACCLELAASGERRYEYAFTNCTNCGPRWSIISGLPYDRPRTSMAPFTMCAACQREYDNPGDRRFHAQPIACPECGPTLRLIDLAGIEQARGQEALQAAAAAVRSGEVLALKGLGGFQLIVDATSGRAVELLRRRKRRPDKPLAVMVADCDVAATYCHLSDFERSQLASAQGPILLLRRRHDGSPALPMADSVAPRNPYLGVMLPNSPLHHLLVASIERPIVCTSGNRSEEPMAISTSDARARLADIADTMLTHDRRIVRPVDDSVCREEAGSLQILRRARGYAPVPVPLARPAPRILAVGGHLKNTVALSLGANVVVSSHVGDLDNTLSLDVHRRAIADLLEFFDVRPEMIACDLHPDYRSTQHAQELARRWDTPLVQVQHHHAHVLSAIAEYHLDGPVLGFAWDGTGFGLDGTVWGSEALLVNGPQWERVAHLRPFSLPGGDRAAREPRRSALGLLFGCFGERAASVELARRWFHDAELATLLAAIARPHLFPLCSSLGRLFDGIATLCGLAETVSFEGQAAMRLEHVADHGESARYDLPLSNGSCAMADWCEMLRNVIDDRARGVPVGRISARFHNALAHMALCVARRVGCRQVVLTGGCFQNRLLTRRLRASLSEAGFEVYTQRLVPPGDGGISLGQILGAIHYVGE